MTLNEIKNKISITPYYEELNSSGIIYNADCLSVLKMLPDKCVDLVLTDPPYGIGKADWDYINFKKLLSEIRDEFMRILRDGGLAFIWIPKKELYLMGKIGFDFDIFIEVKNFAQKRKTDIGIDCWVPIMMLRKGDYQRKNDREDFKNWFMVNSANTGNNENNPRKIDHPSAKDIQICKYIIEKTKSDTILDPFMGSGTTAVAAKELGRRFIGIEISPAYLEICKKRLAQGILL